VAWSGKVELRAQLHRLGSFSSVVGVLLRLLVRLQLLWSTEGMITDPTVMFLLSNICGGLCLVCRGLQRVLEFVDASNLSDVLFGAVVDIQLF
jgi:hypothetical protein